jgi:hypothetical protein
VRLTPFLLLGLMACAGPTDDETDENTSDTGSTDTEDTDVAPECNFDSVDGAGSEGVELSGVVRNEAGEPLANAEIGLCKSVCRTLCTAEDGSFSYTFVPDDTYSFHVAPPHEGEALTELVWPLTFEGTAIVQDVVLPPLPELTALPASAEEVEVATGLFVTVGQGDLTILFEDDPTDIGAVAIGSPQFPLPSGSFIAGWYLEPYNAVAETPLPFSIATPSGVATGGTVRAYMASYDDFQWLDLGTFTDNAGRLEADSAAGEIPVIGTLVLVSEL